jgi:hypothetical protein
MSGPCGNEPGRAAVLAFVLRVAVTLLLTLTVLGLPAADAPAGLCCTPPPTLAWSPDGRSLAITSAYGPLSVADVGGGLHTLVPTGDASFRDPNWSPDGRSIAFTKGGLVQVVDVATGAVRTVAEGNGPSWSPDSRWLAYTAAPAGGPVIVVSRDDGSDRRNVSRGIAPKWSPDGSRLAFEREGVLYTVQPDGTGERRIREGTNALWSPDGSSITAETEGALTIARPDGSVVRVVRDAWALGWSPDGRELAVVRETGAFALNVASGRLLRLSQELLVTPSPGWTLFAVRLAAVGGYDVYLLGRGDRAPRRLAVPQCSGFASPCSEGTDAPDRVVGTDRRDVLLPGAGADVVRTGGGHDRVDAAFGDDLLDGGTGNDVLYGQAGADRLLGEAGVDQLHGGGGADVLDAGAGDDLVVSGGDDAHDTIRCGPGRDRAQADRRDAVAADCERVQRVR